MVREVNAQSQGPGSRALAENFLGGGGGGNQDIIKIDTGITLLEMQLVEKIGNICVLVPITLITALYLHVITHWKKKQFLST